VYWFATFTFKLSSLLDSIEKRFVLSKKFYKANSPPFLAKITISKLTISNNVIGSNKQDKLTWICNCEWIIDVHLKIIYYDEK